MRITISVATVLAMLGTLASAQDAPLSPVAHPELWPKVQSRPALDPGVEAKVTAMLRAMSIEDKVGQIIQADIATVKPADLLTYKLGSVLNGGNSAPNSDELAPPAEWLKLADAFYDASMTRSDGRPKIPVIWGTDAVHGNNNIVGATLFPHNIGLGAARDPALMESIGRITAKETAAAGLDWSFAPTLAVVQDDRWGRTYESYSEDPALVASYAGPVVSGIQGKVGTADFLGPAHVIATTKHFLGDGGTGGRDQGDTKVPETVLRDVHGAGYPPAIAAGTLSVMASFSSWNGAKMHGNASLLTDVLKGRMGFNGFVVGDWNAHGQIPGCTNESCAAAINAGLDMFMMSGDWKKLYANTLAQAKSGEIKPARLDDAVRRILRAKMLAHSFDMGRPSTRPFAGKFDLIGSAEGHAVGRQAVRESLVLLKNDGNVLPLKPAANILVVGKAADTIAQQAGGWSITWQGTDVPNSGFPNATSIWKGIDQAVRAAGGTATYAADGAYATKPDAAIMVFGETPYAEFMGDRPTLEYSPGDKSDLALLRKLKAVGIPVVAVFLSGRPMWVNAELNAADAFVAAFLPGSEGAGVADLLFADKAGKPAHDFRGKLSFSWPRRPDQYVLNRRDAGYDPLFPFGYGLTYADHVVLPRFDETRPAGMAVDSGGVFFAKGRVPDAWSLSLAEGSGSTRIVGNTGRSPAGALTVAGVDRNAQEDARRFTWSGAREADLHIDPNAPLDLSREANGELSLVVQYRVDAAPTAAVAVTMAGGKGATDTPAAVAVGGVLRAAPVGQWQTLAIPLKCFVTAGLDPARVTQPFAMTTSGRLTVSIADVRVTRADVPMDKCGVR
ncbi:glycoside hydrolase family 3 protein [Sphingomonas ginsenosidivorax]|uniref:Glycoside hydrolase family 3 protein n=1 Tax=Sphingomonas ginsenosidivorax TaxID=862135 RepID=A0A5C6UEK5_9SPHN|nr:exo 1,3/1,4-beta-D-glucan glucohydrolase [Sphingomonas ginsenosidivorax]TXC71203.1 glycoside hydrolase family 3 protein [Sphingomonas ginsenosidivorax]